MDTVPRISKQVSPQRQCPGQTSVCYPKVPQRHLHGCGFGEHRCLVPWQPLLLNWCLLQPWLGTSDTLALSVDVKSDTDFAVSYRCDLVHCRRVAI